MLRRGLEQMNVITVHMKMRSPPTTAIDDCINGAARIAAGSRRNGHLAV